MDRNDILKTKTELEGESAKFYGKAFLWALGLGVCLSNVIKNYALSSNHHMMAGVLDEVSKHGEFDN